MEEIKVEIFDDYCRDVSVEEVSALLKKVSDIIAQAEADSLFKEIA